MKDDLKYHLDVDYFFFKFLKEWLHLTDTNK